MTVTSLDGLSIEEYAARVFAEWGVGAEAKDNGVLLLVAPSERRVRIEVGYGVEGSLPDGLAGEIIRTAILPEFRAGQPAPRHRAGAGPHLARGAAATRRPRRRCLSAHGRRRALRHSAGRSCAGPSSAIFVAARWRRRPGGWDRGHRTIALLLAGGLFTVIPIFIAGTISLTSLALLLPLDLAAMAFGYRKGGAPDWIRGIRGDASPGTNDGDWVMGGTAGSSNTSDSSSDSSSSDFGVASGGGGASGTGSRP